MDEVEGKLVGKLFWDRLSVSAGGDWVSPCGALTIAWDSDIAQQAYDREFHLLVCEACQ